MSENVNEQVGASQGVQFDDNKCTALWFSDNGVSFCYACPTGSVKEFFDSEDSVLSKVNSDSPYTVIYYPGITGDYTVKCAQTWDEAKSLCNSLCISDSKISDKDSLMHKVGRALGVTKESIPASTFEEFQKVYRNFTKVSYATNNKSSDKKKYIFVKVNLNPTVQCKGTEFQLDVKAMNSFLKEALQRGYLILPYRPENGNFVLGAEEEAN